MKKVGITGGIGAGKTLVSGIFMALGISIYNADSRAKFLMEEEPRLIDAIKNKFGDDSFKGNKINRDFLAETVFTNQHQLDELNKLVHPYVQKDFEDWVQERGLYFPSEWSDEYTPILGMMDPGQPQSNGSLLVAQYGKGYYIYTGLSFFRELPAGVPGAYRLFANLLSIGK